MFKLFLIFATLFFVNKCQTFSKIGSFSDMNPKRQSKTHESLSKISSKVLALVDHNKDTLFNSNKQSDNLNNRVKRSVDIGKNLMMKRGPTQQTTKTLKVAAKVLCIDPLKKLFRSLMHSLKTGKKLHSSICWKKAKIT